MSVERLQKAGTPDSSILQNVIPTVGNRDLAANLVVKVATIIDIVERIEAGFMLEISQFDPVEFWQLDQPVRCCDLVGRQERALRKVRRPARRGRVVVYQHRLVAGGDVVGVDAIDGEVECWCVVGGVPEEVSCFDYVAVSGE